MISYGFFKFIVFTGDLVLESMMKNGNITIRIRGWVSQNYVCYNRRGRLIAKPSVSTFCLIVLNNYITLIKIDMGVRFVKTVKRLQWRKIGKVFFFC